MDNWRIILLETLGAYSICASEVSHPVTGWGLLLGALIHCWVPTARNSLRWRAAGAGQAAVGQGFMTRVRPVGVTEAGSDTSALAHLSQDMIYTVIVLSGNKSNWVFPCKWAAVCYKMQKVCLVTDANRVHTSEQVTSAAKWSSVLAGSFESE